MKCIQVLLVCFFVLFGCSAFGVSVVAPKEFQIKSRSGKYTFKVVPPEVTTRDSFIGLTAGDFLGVAAKEPNLETISLIPYGMLYSENGAGKQVLVWKRPLPNRVSPTEVMIVETAKGPYIVTFGEWYVFKPSQNMMSIIDATASIVRTLGYAELGMPYTDEESPEKWYTKVDHKESSGSITITKRGDGRKIQVELYSGKVNSAPGEKR